MNLLKELVSRFRNMNKIKDSELCISKKEISWIRKFAYGKPNDILKLIKIESEIITDIRNLKSQNGQKALLMWLKLFIVDKMVFLEMTLYNPVINLIVVDSDLTILENIFKQASNEKIQCLVLKNDDFQDIFYRTKPDQDYLKQLICYKALTFQKLDALNFKTRVESETMYKIKFLLNQLITYEVASSNYRPFWN